MFIEEIINSYASPVFFPRIKTITIKNEEDMHASSSSFFLLLLSLKDNNYMDVNKRARIQGSQNKVDYMAVKEKEDWKFLTFLDL